MPAAKPVISDEGYVEYLTRFGVWATPLDPIAFTFLEQKPGYFSPSAPFIPFSQFQRAGAIRAFNLVSEVTNLDFVQVANNGQEPAPDNRVMTFHAVSVDQLYSGSTLAYMDDGTTDIHGAGLHLNNFHIQRLTANEGFFDWTFLVTLHEILHGVGLSHPGDYNGPGYNYQDHALFQQDSKQYSVMSYWGAFNTGADHIQNGTHYVASTPLLYDILALQTLYGANMTTRTGNTVYGFNSNTGQTPFNFTVNPGPVICIWDAGGTDTINLSGYAANSRINLNDGQFSNAGGLTKNVSIAFGAVIENAVGGSGNDTLIGNEFANRLDGKAGADTLSGGLGNDTYVVDNVGDKAVEGSATGGKDNVLSSVSFTLGNYVEQLTLTGASNINGTGNASANVLTGNQGNNMLSGGDRADTLSGGLGNDRLWGGGGSDTLSGGGGQDGFYFDTPLGAGNVDRLAGFFAADDTIFLDRAVFGAIGTGALAASAFCTGNAAKDASDRIVYDAATGKIFYDADGVGGAAAILFATVNSGTQLTHADFQGFGG